MADPQKPSRIPAGGALLPALDRLAAAPDLAAMADQIGARTKAGDVVLELHGRGGWVARSALDQLRRAFSVETTALTRLVAEIVLRPPDLRHLDAAVSAIAVDARGTEGGLRSVIEASYASRCPSCGNPVIVDEFIWRPRPVIPGSRWLPQVPTGVPRVARPSMPMTSSLASGGRLGGARGPAWALAPSAGHHLPDDAYPPPRRWPAAIPSTETEIRAPSAGALRLAIVHGSAAEPPQRLPGRVAGIRISAGQVRG
jgi:hypothetical protein